MDDILTLHERNKSFSPTVPGLQIAWDSTSLGLIKTCPRKYYYEMIEGWRSRGTILPLVFGIHYHKALESYDVAKAEGKSHEAALAIATRCALQIQEDTAEDISYMPRNSGDTTRNRENLVRNVIWYLEHFKDDAAKTLILKDGTPAVELTFKMEVPFESPDGTPFLLCGHMDRVVDWGGDIYVMDHKTTGGAISDHYWKGYSPNNQVSLYTLAASVVLGDSAKGVIISACQLGVNFTRFARRQINRTQGQTKEWLRETELWIRNAEQYATQGYWPMNETSCMNYGGCSFQKICSADPSMRETFLKSDFVKRVWDPMQAR